MSSFKPQHARPLGGRRARGRRRVGEIAAAGALIAVAIGVIVGLAVAGTGTPRPTPAVGTTAQHAHSGALPAGYKLTGQTSPMGGQIIETPGTRSGLASAGGVSVTDGSDIVMGRVPLAYAVNPTWHLRNTTDHPVTLGRPSVTVVRGCCPADPILGTTTLAPGAETTLEFPTQMHPGMDGDHLFRLAVPVGPEATPLVVSVAGDFS